MLVYDFKYDDLTRIAYNTLLKNHKAFKIKPGFYLINFDDLGRSHRCNPLDPQTMQDITDATESSRSILLGLNKDWITKQGIFCRVSHQFFDSYHLVPKEIQKWEVLYATTRY